MSTLIEKLQELFTQSPKYIEIHPSDVATATMRSIGYLKLNSLMSNKILTLGRSEDKQQPLLPFGGAHQRCKSSASYGMTKLDNSIYS